MLEKAAWENTQETLMNLRIWVWAVVSIILFSSIELVNWLLLKLQKVGFDSTDIESIEQISQSILFEPVAVVVPSSLAFFSWILGILGGSRVERISSTLLKLSQNVLGATTWYLMGMVAVNLLFGNYSRVTPSAISLALSFLLMLLSHWLEMRTVSDKAVMPCWKSVSILVSAALLYVSVLSFLIQGSAAPDNPIYFIPLIFCALFSSFLIWITTRRLQ